MDSSVVGDAAQHLAPDPLQDSAEEKIAELQALLDVAQRNARRLGDSERDPLLKAIAVAGDLLVQIEAEDDPARALGKDQLIQDLHDAATRSKALRAENPGDHPTGPGLTETLRQLFLEMHRLNGRYGRGDQPELMLDRLRQQALCVAGSISSALEDGERVL